MGKFFSLFWYLYLFCIHIGLCNMMIWLMNPSHHQWISLKQCSQIPQNNYLTHRRNNCDAEDVVASLLAKMQFRPFYIGFYIITTLDQTWIMLESPCCQHIVEVDWIRFWNRLPTNQIHPLTHIHHSLIYPTNWWNQSRWIFFHSSSIFCCFHENRSKEPYVSCSFVKQSLLFAIIINV